MSIESGEVHDWPPVTSAHASRGQPDATPSLMARPVASIRSTQLTPPVIPWFVYRGSCANDLSFNHSRAGGRVARSLGAIRLGGGRPPHDLPFVHSLGTVVPREPSADAGEEGAARRAPPPRCATRSRTARSVGRVQQAFQSGATRLELAALRRHRSIPFVTNQAGRRSSNAIR